MSAAVPIPVVDPLTVATNGAASAPPAKITGTWFSGGSATTTKPQLLVEPTGTTSTGWNTGGTGIGVNAASGFAGNLLDFQVAGTRVARVSSSGQIFTTGTVTLLGGGGIVNNNSGGFTGTILSSDGGSGLTLRSQSSSVGVIVDPVNTGVNTVCLTVKGFASRAVALQKYTTSADASLGNVSGGCVADIISSTSTTSTDGTLDTLNTYTLPANGFIVNGDKLFFDYTLTVATHTTNTGRFVLTFGSITIFDSTALTFAAAGTVRIHGYVIRKTSTTCRATVQFAPSGSATILGYATTNYVTDATLTGLTLTGTNSLVLTAAAAGTGAASGDITVVMGTQRIEGFGS